jgi:hypothetical protein
MDGLGDEFLAHPGLTQYQNRGVQFGDLLYLVKYLLHAGAFADELLMQILEADLFSEIGVFRFELFF